MGDRMADAVAHTIHATNQAYHSSHGDTSGSLPVQRVNLCGNHLGRAGAEGIVEALLGSPSLTELNLSQNHITQGVVDAPLAVTGAGTDAVNGLYLRRAPNATGGQASGTCNGFPSWVHELGCYGIWYRQPHRTVTRTVLTPTPPAL